MQRITARRVLATLAMSLLAMLSTAAIVVQSRTVPLDQCRDVYVRLRGIPGVEAAYLEDLRINDSITLDVTVFMASDSPSMAGLLRRLGCSDSSALRMMSTEMSGPDGRFTMLYRDGGEPAAQDALPDVMTVYPIRRTVVIFSVEEERQLDWLLLNNLQETFSIPEATAVIQNPNNV